MTRTWRRIRFAHVGLWVLATLALTACVPGGSSQVPDGRTFGVLESVDLAAGTVTYAPSGFFTGDEAVAEAARDGTTAPSGFYVRRGTSVVAVELAEGATLELLGWDAEGNLIPSPVPPEEFPGTSDAWGRTTYYWFTIEGGKIAEVVAQYTP